MTKVTWEEYEPIPIGEYPVEITNIEVGTSSFLDDNGKPKEQVTWKLAVANGEYKNEKLITWTSLSTSLKGNLAKYAKACGFDIQADQEFDLANLVGCKCLAVVLVKEKDDGTKINKVEELKPIKGAATPTATQQADKQQWACPGGCNGNFMLTAKQIETINRKYGGKCRTCFEKPAEVEDEDPFETNPIPVEA